MPVRSPRSSTTSSRSARPTSFFSFYLVYEADDLDVAAALMQAARETVGGVRLDTWLKLSLRLGRPFFAHDETVPHRTVDPDGNS